MNGIIRIIIISFSCLTIIIGQSQIHIKDYFSSLQEWNSDTSMSKTVPDTLYPDSLKQLNYKSRIYRVVGISVILVSGILTYHFHTEAEKTYQNYLNTGDPEQMDLLFAKTKRLDKSTGYSYLGIEAGLILFTLSFFE